MAWVVANTRCAWLNEAAFAFFSHVAVTAGKEAEAVDVGTWPEVVGKGGKPCDDLCRHYKGR